MYFTSIYETIFEFVDSYKLFLCLTPLHIPIFDPHVTDRELRRYVAVTV